MINDGNFKKMIKDIEAVRIAGFPSIALYPALSIPDICGRVYKDKKVCGYDKVKKPIADAKNPYLESYEMWVRDWLYDERLAYEAGNISQPLWLYGNHDELEKRMKETRDLFAVEIYGLRCRLFHHGDISNAPGVSGGRKIVPNRVFAETPLSSLPEIPIMKSPSEPYGYSFLDIGYLISRICDTASIFYDICNDIGKTKLDDFNRFFVSFKEGRENFEIYSVEMLNSLTKPQNRGEKPSRKGDR